MSNVNSNIASINKKKRKRRKRKFILPQPNPVVVDTPMTRIAALFKLRQHLANKNQTKFKDRPLMSGPRFSPHMKWVNKKFMNPQTQQVRFPKLQTPPGQNTNTPNISQNVSQNISQNDANTSQNESISENTTSQNSTQPSEPGPSSSSNSSGQNFSSFNSKKTKFNQKMHTNNKFDECEVYDSPTFINFESEEALTDLNDDDICNKNVTGGEIKINKQETHFGFKLKLQERYTKRMELKKQETKNKEITMTEASEENNVNKKELTQNDDESTKNNQFSPVSSDSNIVVKEKVNTNICEQNKHNDILQTQNIQNFFMQNPHLGPVQSQRYLSNNPSINQAIYVQTDNANVPQLYSPSDIYEGVKEDSPDNDTEFRPSAFQRLGPPEKTPRITINVNVDSENPVREVVDGSDKYIPTHEKQELVDSEDNTVQTFLPSWPWKSSVVTRKIVTHRNSKTVMVLEKEYMEEKYERDAAFFLIKLEGYPKEWTKENVLDLTLDCLKGKHFVPCFIEFSPTECKFFVIRSKCALLAIHLMGFVILRGDVKVKITIAQTELTLKKLDFIPRIVLRSRLCMGYDGESKLDLSEFTLKTDISHFIYYPLHRNFNQTELVHLQSAVSWQTLTELNLSHNKITCIEGFNLEKTTPKLKVLDLSYNNIESVLKLLPIRQLHLLKLSLEGNPLCHDYIDSDHYIKVLKGIFSSLKEIDGVQIIHESVPKILNNYCPDRCRNIVEKFLEVFFPLLECRQEERKSIQSMYASNAVMTTTHRDKLRYNTTNKLTLNLLIKSRNIINGDFDFIQGSSNIVKLLKKWPNIKHDPTTFTVDVLYSTDTSIIFTINGIFKVTADTLAENESLLSFARTITLYSTNGYEYKITNDMLYLDEPYYEWENKAFQIVSIPKRATSLKFDFTPDDTTKTRLIYILMKLTDADKKQCESYLVEKYWNIKDALELFIEVMKANNIETIH